MSDLPVLIFTHELFHLIFSPCPIEEGETEHGRVGTWQTVKFNPPESAKCTPIPNQNSSVLPHLNHEIIGVTWKLRSIPFFVSFL